MKKVIPFSKEIPFQTKIAEITDIEVAHNLEKTPFNSVEGSFLVNGTYKMHEASQIDESFSYDLPFTIEVDEKYDLSVAKIKISDFFFEIVNDDILKVNIEVELSDVKEKEVEIEKNILERCYDEEDDVLKEIETKEKQEEVIDDTNSLNEKIDIIEPIDILDVSLPKKLEPIVSQEHVIEDNSFTSPITDVFTSISNDEDTFKAYHVYIVRENDTLEDILKHYNLTREEVSEYNNLDDIKIGTKLILPCSNDEL